MHCGYVAHKLSETWVRHTGNDCLFYRVSCSPDCSGTHCGAKDNAETLSSCFLLPRAVITSDCTTTFSLQSSGDWIQARCMLGKHSMNWAETPSLRPFFFLIFWNRWLPLKLASPLGLLLCSALCLPVFGLRFAFPFLLWATCSWPHFCTPQRRVLLSCPSEYCFLLCVWQGFL